MEKNINIIKASGDKQRFSEKKLYKSIKNIGAPSNLAENVVNEVVRKVYPEMKTDKILKEVTRRLHKESPALAARYNLKEAIMQLGPTGFPFEKYVAGILGEYGYIVKIGEQIRGKCVMHEVDIMAKKENKHFMIECKYHNRRGVRSDVKTTLYTYARFLDIKKAWQEREKRILNQAWLVTNTRCTSEAIRYANCVGLKIIGWRYPKNESLEYLIEKKSLYPITVLPMLTRYTKEKLSQQGLMLIRDLLRYSAKDIIRLTGLRGNVVQKLREEAEQVQ